MLNMVLEVMVVNEEGDEKVSTLVLSGVGEEKTVDDFIWHLLNISEDKRRLPFTIVAPNGDRVHPSTKMILNDQYTDVEGIEVTWLD